MVTAQDVLPTLLGATGLKGTTAEFDGADQWPSIERDAAAPTPDYVTQARDGVAFYRFPWKLIQLGSGEVELYQIDEDPTEQVDRAAAEPSVVEDAGRRIETHSRAARASIYRCGRSCGTPTSSAARKIESPGRTW